MASEALVSRSKRRSLLDLTAALALSCLLLVSVGALPASAVTGAVTPDSIITTIAGTGVAGYMDDVSPTSASLYQPRDTAVGPDGSLYIADTFNNRVRRITPGGEVITTFAGTGATGFNGDGIQAVEATITWPHDVTVDQEKGDVYIADSNNNRIRKVTADGVITTVAGTGRPGFSGDGGSATAAKLNLPKSVALYNGSLYIADGKNNRIRVVDPSGSIRTVAGTGVPTFTGDGIAILNALNLPQRLALDGVGNLYVADTLNNRIRRISPVGIMDTIAGTGAPSFSGDGHYAVDAELKAPRGIAVTQDGTVVYFSDTENNRVRQIDMVTGIITTLSGNSRRSYTGDGGPAGAASLYNPRGLTLDGQGRLILADKGHSVIRVITPSP